MKIGAIPIVRRYGFRTVLLVNGGLNVAMIVAFALLSAGTPVVLTCAILFAGGLCRSMQFTALNSLAFADVEPAQMNGANTLASTVTQLTMGMGVAVGAVALRIGNVIVSGSGMPPSTVTDFRFAFLIVGIIALVGTLDYWRLAPDAGAAVAAGPNRQPIAREES